MTADDIKTALEKHANADDAVFLQRFFKTGKGQYGEGDEFIGVRVPATRQVCKAFKDLPLAEVQKLLDSPVHEHRLAGAIILAYKYPKVDETAKQAIYDLYLKNLRRGRINNWDIVDVTVEQVIGAHLEKHDRKVLYELAKSDDVWQKRAAIISTFAYIKKGDPATSLDIIDILLHDPHDLIQKAVGWMLREIGKRVDEKLLTDFLDKHAHNMPRTALRYALEKLAPAQKAHYMALKAYNTK
jgi:3-methyladenine DNA glycosylase AlkD